MIRKILCLQAEGVSQSAGRIKGVIPNRCYKLTVTGVNKQQQGEYMKFNLQNRISISKPGPLLVMPTFMSLSTFPSEKPLELVKDFSRSMSMRFKV